MIRSLLAVLVAATVLLSAGSAWASSGAGFRWAINDLPIMDTTLAAGASRYTKPLSLADGELSKVLGSWSGADSVSIVVEASSDQLTWYPVHDLPLISDSSNGAFRIHIGWSYWDPAARTAFWKKGANWVRVLVSNDDDPTQVGSGTCTHLTLFWISSDGPDPNDNGGPAIPVCYCGADS